MFVEGLSLLGAIAHVPIKAHIQQRGAAYGSPARKCWVRDRQNARVPEAQHFFFQAQTGAVPIRVIIKYTNYKRFGSETKILYNGKQLPDSTEPKHLNQPE